MQVRWLRKALENLNDEAEYIAKDDPTAAQTVVLRVIDAVNLLPENPSMGHTGRVNGTRELVVPKTRYVVPYRVKPRLEQIEILRVFHTSRKSPKSWS